MKFQVEGYVLTNDYIEVKVKDKEKRGSDLCGNCKIKLGDILQVEGLSEQFYLT